MATTGKLHRTRNELISQDSGGQGSWPFESGPGPGAHRSLPSGPAVATEKGLEPTSTLPCLYSNNSTEKDPDSLQKERILALCGILAPYQKRQAHTLFSNVQRLIKEAPSLGHIGFFTLTTKENIKDKAEFSCRWNSMLTHYWRQSPNFGKWLATYEQQKRGAWHLHLLVVLPYDIRTGVNFEEFAQGNYKSASSYLRSLWRELRGACLTYGFGRHELLPVRSNSEAMARYVGKYISKHIGQREESAKGKRLISASQDWIRNSLNFAWNTEGAQEWRRKVALFAAAVGCSNMEQLYNKLGPNWAYKHLDTIYNVDQLIESLPSIVLDGKLTDTATGEILF